MRLSVDNLEEGMVLAADISDATGRLLLPAGTAVNSRHLRYCQMWGVLEVEIVGDDPAPSDEPALDPERLTAARAELEPRFRHVDVAHPLIDALLTHCSVAVVTRDAETAHAPPPR
jgi:hypothetical protein